MFKSLLAFLLVLIVLPAGANNDPDMSKAPTDARSYCARLNALSSVQSYATEYSSAAILFSGLNRSGSAYDKAKIQATRLHALGLDDASRSLAKKVLERINKAVPKKDAYNQDIAFMPYAAWFASCVSSLGPKDPRIVVFLSPLVGDIQAFFNASTAEREQKIIQLMGKPGLGGLDDRFIVEKTGLEFAGINPRWVLPLAIAMTGGDSWIEGQASVVLPVIAQFSASLKNTANVANSMQDGSHPACLRIENSQAVKNYIAAVLELQKNNVRSDQMSRQVDRVFNDQGSQLVSTITSRLRKIATADGKFDYFRHGELVDQFNTILANCAKKNLDRDLFVFFAASADDRDRVEQQRKNFTRTGTVPLNYDGKKPRGGSGFELTPKWASLYAFMFDDADALIEQEAVKNTQEILANLEAIILERQVQAEKSEQAKYAGLRAMYALSSHPALKTAYEKCRRGEKIFQSKITGQIEAEAKTANTVAEQKQLLENASFRSKHLDALTHGMCLYRMNVALIYIETNSDIAALSTGYQANFLDGSDLSAKYTENALIKVANQLEGPAEKFHQHIDDIVRKAAKEINQQRPVTRRQQEQLFANRLTISMFGNIIYSGIFEWLVDPISEGRHLKP